MVPAILHEEKEVLDGVKYLPSVSIILPFEPKMSIHRELQYQLERTVAKVEKKLLASYTLEKAKPVIDKLKVLIKKLDFTTYKRSIAIFVSPLVEKVYYLDIPVEEKLIIDESFEIRDLVYSKKEIHKYLLLVLSGSRSQIFLGNTTQFFRIVSNTAENIADIKDDIPERVGIFSDPADRKEIMLNKFLHHVDNGLGHIVNAYALPLFVMGTDRTIGHFKKITRHSDRIINYIHGNFEDASEAEIGYAIAPYIADWKKIKQNDLLLQLDAAMGARKLATGIQEVWKEATSKKGRLLVVEKNYMYPARPGIQKEIIYPKGEIIGTDFFIKDAIDDIIEKMLESGGDVEFVDEGILSDYQRIALIKYY
jgi:hypothetical protein